MRRPERIEVEAPLGTIPVWVRDGATIPTIDPATETLVPTDTARTAPRRQREAR